MTLTPKATLYGWAEIEPDDDIVVGSIGTWRLTYHTGVYGIDDGGTIKVARRFASDWGIPQMEDPEALDYLTVKSTSSAKLIVQYNPKGYVRPWQKCITIDVYDGALAQGDKLAVTFGDTSDGSPGTTAQTFCEDTYEFRVAVDCFGTGQFVELDDNPVLRLVSGSPAKIVVIVPSQCEVDEDIFLVTKVEDEWGNPCASYRGRTEFGVPDSVTGLPASYTFSEADRGVHRFEKLYLQQAGIYSIIAIDAELGLNAVSNPIFCVKDKTLYRPYWADMHGQSEETVGTNSIDDYFRYARDVSHLDISCHQGNDFQVTREFWQQVQQKVKEYHEPHRFITFLGYEWSANTPAGGDHNVYYLKDDEPIHRSSHWQIWDRSDEDTDRCLVTQLYETLRHKKAITIPHVGGRPANLDYHDPDVEPLVEIYSAWGEFEWMLTESLKRGYRVGCVAGSDDHKGRPGASYPGSSSFGVYGGLTGIFAEELTREAIWDALRSRRCYATTGQRIFLKVLADGHWMGDEYTTDGAAKIRVQAIGTDIIEKIEVIKGTEVVFTHPTQQNRVSNQLRIIWSGARIIGRRRLAKWDGFLELDRGEIIAVRSYAFDSPVEKVIEEGSRKVSWISSTAGDADGIILTLNAPEEAKLRFQSNIVAFPLSLNEIQEDPVVIECGGVDLRVTVEWLPAGTKSHAASFEYVEQNLPKTTTPYYVRVLQLDGAKAWSSPIWISRL